MADRWGYRLSEIAERTGLSPRTVRRLAEQKAVEIRHFGSAVVLEARGAERVFGFEGPVDELAGVSDEALESALRLVG